MLKPIFQVRNIMIQFNHARHKLITVYFILVIGVNNQLPNNFGTALVCNKIFMHFSHLTSYYIIYIKSELSVTKIVFEVLKH